MVVGRAGTYRTRVRGRSVRAHAGPPRRAGGARRAKERAYRARERAGRAREWDGGARAKFTESTAPYEYVGKNRVTAPLPSLVQPVYSTYTRYSCTRKTTYLMYEGTVHVL
jgi:hypothetical protein